MELLERYLAAVRRNLPATQSDDIVAELREELLDRADAEEARTGHVDWSALLRRNGHPLVVAGRYRAHQSLIGPELYPFYLYSLRLFGGLALLGVAFASAIGAATHPDDIGHLVVRFLGSLWWATATVVGTTTIVFALIERYGGMSKHFQDWRPEDLPDADREQQPGRWEGPIETVLTAIVLLWWIGVVPTPWAMGNASFRIAAGPVWQQLYWPILVLIAARLVHNLVAWLRPHWRSWRMLLAIATTAGAIVLAVIVYRAGQWLTVVPIGAPTADTADLQRSIELAVRIGIAVAAVVWTIKGVQELLRWRRDGRR
ncbi:MAG: hypothetical protein J0I47_12205 [Sphingomonas sp.]|uniref:HAAS signaling domain-containing protein n=1 Tax=Sphingomonas sp. TaxID=28214 RepID=UPI001AC304EB|nr:hypothetical protein [Sphingomonas sp.]MBN8808978.1 hypothetical protein [Sphingomonas sp.]